MFVKQISVFLENLPGALCELTNLLGTNGIDLMALSIADTQNFGIIRIIVSSSQIDHAIEILRGNGYTARFSNVVCIAVEDRPNGLSELLEKIKNQNESVEYMYSFLRKTEDALMIMRLSDQETTAKKLADSGVRIYTQEEIDQL